MRVQGKVVATLTTSDTGEVTRIRVDGLPKSAACLRFFDIPGNRLTLGAKVAINISEIIEDAENPQGQPRPSLEAYAVEAGEGSFVRPTDE